jgi:hypothetical protein
VDTWAGHYALLSALVRARYDDPLGFHFLLEPGTTILAFILAIAILFFVTVTVLTEVGVDVPVVSSWVKNSEQSNRRQERAEIAHEKREAREAARAFLESK